MSRDATAAAALVAAGAALGAGCVLLLNHSERRRKLERNAEALPPAYAQLAADPAVRRVYMREWEEPAWRAAKGWQGTDYIHKPGGDGVVILGQYLFRPESGELLGFVRFGVEAESHAGLCHGGAMCSVLDDFCGHCAFVNSDGPWSGATVQVNCKLLKPVAVGDVLQIVGRVAKREQRKLWISAELRAVDANTPGGAGGALYAELDGLSIAGVKLQKAEPEYLELRDRKWSKRAGMLCA